MKIVFIVGSLRKQSYNQQLAKALAGRLPDTWQAEFVSCDVPLFSEDRELDPPVSVLDAASLVGGADAVAIISPEYNRSLPGSLKNLIDWLSRPCTDLPLKGKPVGIGGVSTGPIRTAVMQSHLRSILLQVGAEVMPQLTIMLQIGAGMDPDGQFNAETTEFLDKFVESLIGFATSK